MKILVTGGPVHGKIDAVKIVTNIFRGGWMASLATSLSEHADIIYLCTKDSKQPVSHASLMGGMNAYPGQPDLKIVHHDGIYDYLEKVKEIAPTCDGVVLGAAVANLIPLETIKGKFPSHNYKPGDVIPINFTIAPRIIDEVKKVAPYTKLFGFKLLSGVTQDELVRAAYGVLLESKSTLVFANQTGNLENVFTITKERGVIPTPRQDLSEIILTAIRDEYYKSVSLNDDPRPATDGAYELMNRLLAGSFRDSFVHTPEGYVFGTIALPRRRGDGRIEFLTTGRGKNETEDLAYVAEVNHRERTVYTYGSRKATLNAPLLENLFRKFPRSEAIVHFHRIAPNYPILPYAPSGTVRDSLREVPGPRFNIDGHGMYEVIGA